jgi:hypothetical protein
MGFGQFKCAVCGGTFEKTRSDDEAMVETNSVFSPSERAEGLAIVCDDCFKKFMAHIQANPHIREN